MSALMWLRNARSWTARQRSRSPSTASAAEFAARLRPKTPRRTSLTRRRRSPLWRRLRRRRSLVVTWRRPLESDPSRDREPSVSVDPVDASVAAERTVMTETMVSPERLGGWDPCPPPPAISPCWDSTRTRRKDPAPRADPNPTSLEALAPLDPVDPPDPLEHLEYPASLETVESPVRPASPDPLDREAPPETPDRLESPATLDVTVSVEILVCPEPPDPGEPQECPVCPEAKDIVDSVV